MDNQDVRNAITAAGIKYWELAGMLGVDPATLSKWLRLPLPADKRQRILAAISKTQAQKIFTSAKTKG